MRNGFRPPSGRQHELRCDGQRAVIVAVGGGIREYAAHGCEVLDGYSMQHMADGARGQLLVPWPNRIRDGRYVWESAEQQLALTEPSAGHAIHGLARWSAWETLSEAPDAVTLGLALPPQPGYPFQVDLEVCYRLDARGLTVEQRAINAGDRPCPYASGCHPYLRCGVDTVGELRLCVPAQTQLVVDERSIPVGQAAVGGKADFRSLRRVGEAQLDVAYTDLERDAAGIATVGVEGGGHRAEVWVDAAHTHVMVFSGDTLTPSRRRRGLAVEPMTAAPNAFNSGAGLRTLEPGETFTATWGIRPVR